VRLIRSLESPENLSAAAVSLLGRLRAEGPTPLGELARAERVSQPNMTQLVTRLERAGLVQRAADPWDKRIVLVAIAKDGRKALTQRRRARTDALRPLIDRLSKPDRAAIAAALPALGRLTSLETGTL
jgi:DNA-binding MarR family transcriptional regulator